MRPTLVPMLAATLAVALAACQSTPATRAPRIEGLWGSLDAQPPFQTTFGNDGVFTTRLVSTGEVVISDGRYNYRDGSFTLIWTSNATNESRSAACTVIDPNQLTCAPSVGQSFTMTRVA